MSQIDYFYGALSSRNNAVVLKDSAVTLFNGENKHHGLFLLYTACEELEKAIFCILVHYNYITAKQIKQVFKDHRTKIILFDIIYRTLSVKDGQLMINYEPLCNLDLDKIVKDYEDYWLRYKKDCESCLYVQPLENVEWPYPKNLPEIEQCLILF